MANPIIKYPPAVYIGIIYLAAIFLTSCIPSNQDTGILKGHVTIGPLVPVQRQGEPEPTPAPEVYAARKVVIYDEGSKEIAQVDIDAKGNYQIRLPVGNYIVDINHLGIDRAAGLPAQVETMADQETVLDIDIDTGIRAPAVPGG